jgi:hypothetical protein
VRAGAIDAPFGGSTMHAAPLYCKDVTVSLTERGLAKLLNERNLRPDPMRCLRASALRSTSRA